MHTPSFESHPGSETSKFEAREKFLEKDLEHLNRVLANVFAAIDHIASSPLGLKGKVSGSALQSGDRASRFLSRYGEDKMRAVDVLLGGALESDADDYKAFCDIIGSAPELMPRLLSKMVHMEVPEGFPEQQKDEPERSAFNRFLLEYYGREKAFKVEKDESGAEHEIGFLSLEGQAALVEAWNLKGEWGFTEKQFDDIRNQIPELRERMEKYEKEALVAPVLVPYLEGTADASGEQRTYEKIREVMLAQQPYSQDNIGKGYGDGDFEQHLYEGIEHTPGLRFEIIDFGANRGIATSTLDRTRLPHAGVLAAAAIHTEWSKSLGNGDDIPAVKVGGYVTNLGGYEYKSIGLERRYMSSPAKDSYLESEGKGFSLKLRDLGATHRELAIPAFKE